MRPGDLSQLPNPFAPDPPRSLARRSLVSAAKLFAVVVVALVVLSVVSVHGPRWLAGGLAHGFDSLSPKDKKARLVQLSELGAHGIPPLVNALADSDTSVAQQAYDLIDQSQREWTTTAASESNANKLALVQALQTLPPLPGDRNAWVNALMQRTIVESVGACDDVGQQVFMAATQVIDGSQGREERSFATNEKPLVPSELSPPLPIASVLAQANWTDWPPPRANVHQASAAHPNTKPVVAQVGFVQPTAQAMPEKPIAAEPTPAEPTLVEPTLVEPSPRPATVATTASVYQSGAKLQRVADNDPVSLQNVRQEMTDASTTIKPNPSSRILANPFQDTDTRTVIGVLSRPQIRADAQAELARRGFTDTQIAIAGVLANGNPEQRIDLIDQITANQSIDSRPWLLLMLDDADREVKLSAVNALGDRLDPEIRELLQQRVMVEGDRTVAFRIRQVLQVN